MNTGSIDNDGAVWVQSDVRCRNDSILSVSTERICCWQITDEVAETEDGPCTIYFFDLLYNVSMMANHKVNQSRFRDGIGIGFLELAEFRLRLTPPMHADNDHSGTHIARFLSIGNNSNWVNSC